MASWRFYQGLRAEWRWYQLDETGNVIAESDQGFAELQGCMANAETAGFSGGAFQVYARQSAEAAPPGAGSPDAQRLSALTLPTEKPDEPGPSSGDSDPS